MATGTVAVWQNGVARTPPQQPKASIATASGQRFTMPFAPPEADLGGWADTVTSLERPGRRPAVVRTGDGLNTLAFSAVVARRSLQSSVEDYLAALKKVAESGQILTIAGLSKFEVGPWRMSDMAVKITQRAAGTNAVTRADVNLSFVAASDPVTKIGPVASKQPKKKKLTKTVHLKFKKGDTLIKYAAKYYGDPTAWPQIAKASKIKNVKKIPIGFKITIPKN